MGQLLRWSCDGYKDRHAKPNDLTVLTLRAIVEALRTRYVRNCIDGRDFGFDKTRGSRVQTIAVLDFERRDCRQVEGTEQRKLLSSCCVMVRSSTAIKA